MCGENKIIDLRLEVREGVLEQVHGVFPQELGVCHIGISDLGGSEKGCNDSARLDQTEHAGKDHALVLESRLVVVVGQDVEDVVQQVQEVRLVECLGNGWLTRGEVVDDLVTDLQSSVGNITHRVLKGPHNTVHDKAKLSRRKLHESYFEERE